jgi:hypothetical protein
MAFEYQGKPGPGRFQWSRGGWFGGQIGATLWVLLLGVLMLDRGRATGAVVLALGLGVNALGAWLWRGRHEREPYPAIQLLLGACAGVAVVSVWLASAADSANEGFAPSLPVLLVYPGLMLLFHLQEQAARRSAD